MRLVVIGAGRMGVLRARLLAEHPDVTEVALSGRESARLYEVAAQLGLSVVPLEQAFAPGADGVVISTATSSHAVLLASAIEAGVTTFCEKPLTADPIETARIAALADERSVTVQVGYHRRFDPSMRALRGAIDQGRAGKLYTIRLLSHDHVLSPPEFIPTSGGIFRDLHVHDFDLLRWLTGNEISTVFAQGTIRLHQRYAATGDADTSSMLLTMSDGLVASVSGARHDPLGHDVRVEVYGSLSSLVAGLTDRTPLEAAGEPLPWRSEHTYTSFVERFAEAFEAETSAFVELVRGERVNPCPPSEDVAAIRAAVACERSRLGGCVVAVEAGPAATDSKEQP